MHGQKLAGLLEAANKAYAKLYVEVERLENKVLLSEALLEMRTSLDNMNKFSEVIDQSLERQYKTFANLDQNHIVFVYEGEDEAKLQSKDNEKIEKVEQSSPNPEERSSMRDRASRGPYRQYNQETKENVVQLFRQGFNYNKIAKTLKIPSKNVIRWCKNGIHRKPGAGRKVLDPEMEEKLYEWIKENHEIAASVQIQKVRLKAKQLSKVPDFYASLGWFKNFSKRYSLKQKYTLH